MVRLGDASWGGRTTLAVILAAAAAAASGAPEWFRTAAHPPECSPNSRGACSSPS
jgi:hypothetical protein